MRHRCRYEAGDPPGPPVNGVTGVSAGLRRYGSGGAGGAEGAEIGVSVGGGVGDVVVGSAVNVALGA